MGRRVGGWVEVRCGLLTLWKLCRETRRCGCQYLLMFVMGVE